MTKFGRSKAAAERALKLALRDRVTPGQSDITGDTKAEILARRWLAELPADRSANTRQLYSYVLDNYVVPALGALRVQEVGTPAIDRTLKRVTSVAGPGAAKTARSVLSGMFRLAVRHGAVSTNPVREAAPIATPRKPRVRALTRDEVAEMMSLLRGHERAIELDLPDLVDFPSSEQPNQRVRCDAGPYSWVISHIFRKTVATRLDEAGLSARQIADRLGHAKPSITQDV